MRDIFSEGLLYLDLLEIYGSTYAVAEICGIAQSNVFRGANACAKLLNLGLSKDKENGRYRVKRNLDVQRDLRKLNQRMRAREHGFLRVVGAEEILSCGELSLEQVKTHRSLPVRWPNADLSLDYLERALLDIVVVRSLQVQKRIHWPPAVRRRDLFVPVDPFAATELAVWPLVLLSSRNNASHRELSLLESCELEWVVDPSIPLEPVQAAYPSATLHAITDQAWSAESIWAQLQANPRLLWLTDLGRFKTLNQQSSTFDWLPLNLDVSITDHLLAITLLPLIREPIHQSLIQLLRQLSKAT